MNALAFLTLHGALMFLILAGLDRLCGASVSARTRRAAWLLAPLAFALSIPVPLRLAALPPTANPWPAALRPAALPGDDLVAAAAAGGSSHESLLWIVVLGGAGAYLLISLARTRSALLRWGRERLCTDPSLLRVLEDCKRDAGITAPIGLVVSEAVAAPVILGWLRPRIILPPALVESVSVEQLRGVLFHELAHFRAMDVPLNWVFTAVCALHWFNPCAHLAFRAWSHRCEEAADETAIGWLRAPSGLGYGETLLHVLRNTNQQPTPYAALAIVESIHHLKTRITMIKQYEHKSPHRLAAALVLALLAAVAVLHPVRAADPSSEPNDIANGPMQAWLQEVDDGKYEQSWNEAAPVFQKAINAMGWAKALTQVRTPLGKCTSRKLASASRETQLPSPTGKQEGDYILAQYESSFDGLKYAIETLTFSKGPDGAWKAAGYYIKPK